MQPISSIKVENFLSLRDVEVRLDPLNVLVGPNGAGKTNLLKVFQFLGEVARAELAPAIADMGGLNALFFRGSRTAERSTARDRRVVKIELTGVITQHASTNALDEYKLSFWEARSGSITLKTQPVTRIQMPAMIHRHEELKFKRTKGQGRRITLSGGKVSVGVTSGSATPKAEENLKIEGAATGLGTLRRLSTAYGAPQWNSFAEVVEQLRLFEIDVEKARRPGQMDSPSILRPDASNLSSFLLWLREEEPDAFDSICDDVRFVLPSFKEFVFSPVGGSDEAVRVDIKEHHLSGTTPLARASFGTIRAIALFAMLHDPAPPRLTCLEEVDHGLHPHALDRLVERLREASERTQIILATHSPALVNRLNNNEIIVVEREEDTGGSRVFRPSVSDIELLQLETGYQLGELWFSGALGGGL